MIIIEIAKVTALFKPCNSKMQLQRYFNII